MSPLISTSSYGLDDARHSRAQRAMCQLDVAIKQDSSSNTMNLDTSGYDKGSRNAGVTSPKDPQHPNGQRQLDPLKVLPTEIWMLVLCDVFEDHVVGALPLLLVSRHWMDLITTSPPLWTHVYVRDSDGDYEEALTWALKYSRSYPLTVTIELPAVQGRGHRIWGEVHRIKEITFRRSAESIRNVSAVDVSAMDYFYDKVYMLLNTFESIPIENITVDHSFDFYSLSMMKQRFPKAPKLKGLTYWCLTTESFSSVDTENLEFLSASSSLDTLYPYLAPLQRLRRLVLTQAGEGSSNGTSIPVANSKSLPPLETLEFYQSSPRSLRPFIVYNNTHLLKLHVKLSWEEFCENAPFFSNLSSLNYLHIILKAPTAPVTDIQLLLPSLPHVQRFELDQQTAKDSPETVQFPVSPQLMASVLDVCGTSLPGIKNLYLHLVDPTPIESALQLLERMKLLQKLDYRGQVIETKRPARNARLRLERVEKIVLSSTLLLAYLDLPIATHISIRSKTEENGNTIPIIEAPKVQTLMVHASSASIFGLNTFPRLDKLTWIDPGGGCASIPRSIHNLTQICFDYSSPRKECNDFCELLLRYPFSCRGLHTIEMRAYPEWDILFLMLVRRNVEAGDGVARISTIKMPGFPGVSLLQPMTRLLSGCMPEKMPPLSELSLGTVDGPYFDVSVLGCEDCIDCRMTCTVGFERHSAEKYKEESLTDLDTSVQDPAEVKALEGSSPSLPADLEAWFDGWSSRRRLWYAKWMKFDRHTRRKGACERHNYNDLVSITGDTLHGIPFHSYAMEYLFEPGEHLLPVPVDSTSRGGVQASTNSKTESIQEAKNPKKNHKVPKFDQKY